MATRVAINQTPLNEEKELEEKCGAGAEAWGGKEPAKVRINIALASARNLLTHVHIYANAHELERVCTYTQIRVCTRGDNAAAHCIFSICAQLVKTIG
jgi:hypothetical protein